LQPDSAQPSSGSVITRYIVSGLILVVFIVFVEVYFGWAALLQPWQQLSFDKVLLAVVLVFFSYWVRAMRLYDVFRNEMQPAFLLCFKLLLPMRTGELSFPILMARYFNVPMKQSIPVLLGFRLLDLHTLALFALLASGTHWLTPAATMVLTVLWCVLPAIAYKFSRQLVVTLDRHNGEKLNLWLKKALAGLPHTARRFYMAWMWTLINWVVKLGVFAWVLLLFIDIPPAAALIGAIMGDVTTVLPVHGLAGAGTYEAGVVAGLLPFKIPATAALQAAVNLHVFVLASTLFGGALSLLPVARKAYE
jgi:uncharacterized membrane protein YbhN (UPF0104 family)